MLENLRTPLPFYLAISRREIKTNETYNNFIRTWKYSLVINRVAVEFTTCVSELLCHQDRCGEWSNVTVLKYSSQSMRRLILLAQIGVWRIYQRRVVVHHSGPDDGSDLRSVGDGKEVSSTFTGSEDFKSYIVFLAVFSESLIFFI